MKRNLTAGASTRQGFTLPEILVVLTIIAVLVALLSAAAAKFRDAQVATTTDAQLSRLQNDLNDTYSRSVQRCRTEDRPSDALIQACGNRDIAQAVHLAATLKASFPESFAEATTAPTVQFTVGGTPFTYQPKKTFASVTNVTGAAADKQRAILLYLILTERGSSESGPPGERRTEPFATTTPGVTKDLTYFIDLYGQPITYYRWGWISGTPLPTSPLHELLQPPFTQGNATNFDPLDPQGWVWQRWSTTSPTGTTVTANELSLFRTNTNLPGFTAPLPGLWFANSNRVPTVVSYGKNKTFDGTPTSFGGDDHLGYRLNRLGGQGQQGN